MTTKQSIHEEFEKEFGDELTWTPHSENEIFVQLSKEVKSFYDTKIQQLLEGILPKERLFGGNETQMYVQGFNQAINEIRENIKKLGY